MSRIRLTLAFLAWLGIIAGIALACRAALKWFIS